MQQQQRSGQPLLEAGPLPIRAIREEARLNLLDCIDSRRGKKVLVLDPRVSGPLGLIAEVPLLKEHGVEGLVHLSTDAVSTEARNIVYLVRPTLQNAQTIARQVHANLEGHSRQSGSQQLEHSIFFVPRRTTACTQILEEEGILGDVTIGELALDLIPFEADLLSLELSTAYRECVLDGDLSSIFYAARAITKFQALVGTIPRVLGKGPLAAAVSDLLQRLRRDVVAGDGAEAAAPSSAQVDALVLVDRQVDLLTPMCTQLTYEGLIDEVLGIRNGAVEIDDSSSSSNAVAGVKRTKTPLNSSDKLFQAMRDVNFACVGPMLRDRAMSLKSDYRDLQPDTKTVGQMKDFVKKLNSLPELNRHTHIADLLSQAIHKPGFTSKLKVEQSLLDGYSLDSVSDQIEEMMYKMEDPWVVLRLLCIASLVHGGIPTKRFDSIRREFLLSYGHEYLLLLTALQNAGVLCRQDGAKAPFSVLKSKMNLIVESISESNPEDIAYTYSGYAPLSCRLVEYAMQNGWKAHDELLKILPGPKFDYTQGWDANGVPVSRTTAGDALVRSPGHQGASKTIAVFFVGGVTYAEVSALRFLGRRNGVNIVVLTTQIMNGSSVLESFLPDALHIAIKRKQTVLPM